MPCRALFSLLIALTGTLVAPAAPAGSDHANKRFQPGRDLQPKVLRPTDRAGVRPADQPTRVRVISARSRAWTPGRVNLLKPAAVAVSPAAPGQKP